MSTDSKPDASASTDTTDVTDPTAGPSLGAEVLLWLVCLALLGAASLFQTRTGPSYPLRGAVQVAGQQLPYALPRTGISGVEEPIEIPGAGITGGRLHARRYNTDDPWAARPLQLQESGDASPVWSAPLPTQPPAGKMEYHVTLETAAGEVRLPPAGEVVLRYRGGVPAWALIPHIVLMFAALPLATRSLLGALLAPGRLLPYVVATVLAIVGGGLIFGPIVQKFAFGDYWTGWPYGTDWTDNKTAVAAAAWLLPSAVWLVRRRGDDAFFRAGVLLAALATLAIFLIPHSIHGSELDYAAVDAAAGAVNP